MAQEINRDFDLKLKKFALSFRNILCKLQQQRGKMLITMHRYLDGDAFGSAVALGLLLRKLDIGSTLLCIPFVPEKFKFLGRISRLHIVEPLRFGKSDARGFYSESLKDYFSETLKDYGALAVLDCAGIGQIPEEAWSLGKELGFKINIDHHIGYELNCPDGSSSNLVGDLSSTSEVLYRLMQEIRVPVFPEIALALYIGIIADLRKNDVAKDSPYYPKAAIKALGEHVRTANVETQRRIKSIFSLDPWEAYLLKMIQADIRTDEDIVYVKFDPDMVYRAKAATDAIHNRKMPFHEFHIRLRQGLRRFKKDFQIVVIFDQILGKVSLYDLHKKDRFDLAGICKDMGNGGGHVNRAGFSFRAAREKLVCSDRGLNGSSDDIIMERIVAVINARMAGRAKASVLKSGDHCRATGRIF